MNKTLSFLPGSALLVVLLGIGGCGSSKPEDPAPATSLVLEFQHVVGNVPLTLGQPALTRTGEVFTLSRFDYYVSNIQLLRPDGSVFAEPESYHLIKESDAASKRVTVLEVPPGDYSQVRLTVGVDSARNVAGAQDGALDPLNGMFWTWNTGYIFLKAEGSASQATPQAFAIHVGGFQGVNNAIRTVTLPVPGGRLTLTAGAQPLVHVRADVQKLFTGPHPLSLNEAATAPVTQVADNYAAGMFSLDDVH